jgi:hypothetical protein
LTPSARSGNLIAGDGTKNGLSRSEQRTGRKTQNNRLTEKAPYKFESISLQAKGEELVKLATTTARWKPAAEATALPEGSWLPC